MRQLEFKHPNIAKEFAEGKFTVRKTLRSFSCIAIDHAHEQNNAFIKGDGGAIGLTDNPSAFRRWIISGPEVSRIITEFEDQTQFTKDDHRHHDQTPSVQNEFVKDVQSLAATIEELGNPL